MSSSGVDRRAVDDAVARARAPLDGRGVPYERAVAGEALAPSRRIYVYTRQRDPEWHTLRAHRDTATSVPKQAGLDDYTLPHDFMRERLGLVDTEAARTEEDRLVMSYGVQYEERSQTAHSALTGMPVYRTGFIVRDGREEVGISPDAFMPPCGVVLAVVDSATGAVVERQINLGATLVENKTSPYGLPLHFKPAYVCQTHVAMKTAGVEATWGTLFHQDRFAEVLVLFSPLLHAWLEFRHRLFGHYETLYRQETIDITDPRELARRALLTVEEVRRHPLFAPVGKAAVAAWYPRDERDVAFAAAHAGHVTLTDAQRAALPSWAHTEFRAEVVMLRVPPRPQIYELYRNERSPLPTEPKAARGYVDPAVWPKAPLDMSYFAPMVSATRMPAHAGEAVVRAIVAHARAPIPSAILRTQHLH